MRNRVGKWTENKIIKWIWRWYGFVVELKRRLQIWTGEKKSKLFEENCKIWSAKTEGTVTLVNQSFQQLTEVFDNSNNLSDRSIAPSNKMIKPPSPWTNYPLEIYNIPSDLSTLSTLPINSFDESLFEWRKLVPMVCYRSLTRANLVLHVINKLLTADFFE